MALLLLDWGHGALLTPEVPSHPLPRLTWASCPHHRYSALSETKKKSAMDTWEERWQKFVAGLARGPR